MISGPVETNTKSLLKKVKNLEPNRATPINLNISDSHLN